MVTSSNQILSIAPLENGDRLSLTEFERRYKAMPQVKKADLVAGLVYMASLHYWVQDIYPVNRVVKTL